MGELIELIINIIVAVFEKASKGSPQEQQRKQWERQKAFEQWQKEQAALKLAELSRQRPAIPLPAARRLPPTRPPAQRAAAPAPARQSAPVAAEASRGASASVGAPAIGRWMQPKTLKSQFILTEILRPPAALRRPKW